MVSVGLAQTSGNAEGNVTLAVELKPEIFFLSASLDIARASKNHFFLSLDFHGLWLGHNDCLSFTEVKQQWTSSVH